MYCHIKYADTWGSSGGSKSISEQEFVGSSSKVITLTNKTLTINPDCYVQILLDYVKDTIQFPSSVQFDFCDEYGRLLNIYSFKECEYATNIFKHKGTYIIVLYEKNEFGKITTVEPYVHKTNKFFTELCARINKRFSKGRGLRAQRKSSNDSGIDSETDLSLNTISKQDEDITSIKRIFSGRKQSKVKRDDELGNIKRKVSSKQESSRNSRDGKNSRKSFLSSRQEIVNSTNDVDKNIMKKIHSSSQGVKDGGETSIKMPSFPSKLEKLYNNENARNTRMSLPSKKERVNSTNDRGKTSINSIRSSKQGVKDGDITTIKKVFSSRQ